MALYAPAQLHHCSHLQLNTGEAWAWAICIICVAWVSKFLPCFAAGRWVGFTTRESGAIGALMSCKGLCVGPSPQR